MRSLWLLTNGPSPYQVELFNQVAAQGTVALQVHFLRDSTSPGPARNFPSTIHRSWLSLTKGDELRFHGRIVWKALFGQHDLFILSGLYTSITFLCCAAILHMRGKAWAIWWERPHSRATAEPTGLRGWLHRIKNGVRHWLLTRAKGVIGIGTAAVDAYAELGVRRERLFLLPYCCDIQRFETQASLNRRPKKRGDPLRFLYSGQMIPRKGVDILLRAFEQLSTDHSHVTLTLLGDGPDRVALESSVPLTLKSRVQFLGLVPQAELPTKFEEVDLFVFPSRHDGWAVVINEACGARLPIIATRQTGAAHDLVRDGENGFLVDADDVDGIARAMTWFIEHPETLIPWGQRSRDLVEPFTAQNGAKQMAHIVAGLSESGD